MINILSQIHTAMGSDEDISDQVIIGFLLPCQHALYNSEKFNV